jgi:hypothetical protein
MVTNKLSEGTKGSSCEAGQALVLGTYCFTFVSRPIIPSGGPASATMASRP